MLRPALAAAFLLAWLGATLHAQVRPEPADSTDVLVLDHDFTRFRILGRARSGQSNWEFGALLRFGIGIIPESNDTPTTWGPGAYVARQIRSSSRRGGWSIQAAYSRSLFSGFSKPLGAVGDVTPKSHRLTLGIGWYQ